jgi:UDP-N-acetylglucosamine acyltransferase
VAPGATIGDGARIGPFCTIGPDVTIGAGAHLISHVVVDGHTSIGEAAVLFPFCAVGLAPQDLKYAGEPTLCEVGARTQIREHVTVHRGTVTGSFKTVVGADCLLMGTVHVAHDCELGNGVVIANNVAMGGHVTIGDNAIIGGLSAIHQFVRIGRGAMVGGVTGVTRDVIPFGEVYGNRGHLKGLNLIGLKRRGFGHSEIQALRAAFRQLFLSPGVFAERLAEVRVAFAEVALVSEILAFIDAPSKRGLLPAAAREDEAAG